MKKIKFELLDGVIITEIKRPGTIILIWITETGIKYETVYFYEGKRHSEYLYDFEIEKKGG